MKTIALNKQGECFTVKAQNTGLSVRGDWENWGSHGGKRTVTFKVCLVGPPPQANLSVTRGGRRGGVRGVGKTQGGMAICQAHGQSSKCLLTKSAIIFPGGGARLRRKQVNVMSGVRRKRRRR